jgi:hypothetical protein
LKLKALVITFLFAAGVAASVAVAKGPPPGKGKNKGSTSASSSTSTSTTSGPGKGKGKKKDGTSVACKPTVSFVLKGEFAGMGAAAPAPVAGASPSAMPALATFELHVKQANSHGRKYVGESVSISVDAKTKFKRRGHADLEDFEEGDWLNVHVRACHPKKASAGSGTTTTPTTSTSTTASTPAAQPVLLAKQVIGKPAKASGESSTTESTPTTTAP